MAGKIEKVSKGVSFGEHKIGTAGRKAVFLIKIDYQDNSIKSMMLDGKCVAFTEDSLLVKVKREWRFYDADFNLLSTKTVAEIGQCVEVTDKFYLFQKDGNYLPVNSSGEITPYPSSNWIGIPVDDIFRVGITRLKQELEKASCF